MPGRRAASCCTTMACWRCWCSRPWPASGCWRRKRWRRAPDASSATAWRASSAPTWAARMHDTAEHRSGDLILLVADMARAVQPMGSGFVAELARRLQGQGGALAQALAWIDARLADDGSGIAQQVQAERGAMAADGI